MSSSLYRKYRPKQFAQLVGQTHVAKALQNALSQDRLAHAYLFSGTRGTGKTSTARILGQVLNCQQFNDGFPANASDVEPCGECESCVAAKSGSSFDVIELDAASNNGVEDMRELIEKVSYASSGSGRKVYIIDEVHELTGRASNTLLKTLEEPPSHVVFILATTNPEKVLPTIRSRTQHFEFLSLTQEALVEHVKNVLLWEEKTLDDETVEFVAKKGAGSVRDTLSFLDQVLALGVSSFEEFNQTHSSLDISTVLDLITAVANNDIANATGNLHEIVGQGKEPRAVVENIINVARDALVLSLNPDTAILLSDHNDRGELQNIGEKCGTNFLRNFILQLGKAISDMRSSATLNPLLNVEIALLASMPQSASKTEVVSNVAPVDSQAPIPVPRPEARPETRPEKPVIPTVPKTSQIPKPQDNIGETQSAKPKATLGALKTGAVKPDDETEKQVSQPNINVRKISIRDIEESWPKVLELLSAASRDLLQQIDPQKIQDDILFFQAPKDKLDDIKERFKKDASIIRGFIESLHEKTFKFQLVPIDDEKQSQQEKEMIEESQEFNAVEHVVDVFGGEIIQDNS